MTEQLPILMRPANADDVGFIFNSWLKSFRNSEFATSIANEIYYSEQHKAIEALLQNYETIVASNQEDPSQIYGFACAGYTENIFTLHYVYVKHTFRRMGIGEALLNAFEHNPDYAAVYTHKTRNAKVLAEKYNLVYHPYIGLNSAAYIKPQS